MTLPCHSALTSWGCWPWLTGSNACSSRGGWMMATWTWSATSHVCRCPRWAGSVQRRQRPAWRLWAARSRRRRSRRCCGQRGSALSPGPAAGAGRTRPRHCAPGSAPTALGQCRLAQATLPHQQVCHSLRQGEEGHAPEEGKPAAHRAAQEGLRRGIDALWSPCSSSTGGRGSHRRSTKRTERPSACEGASARAVR